ncbi:MAG: DUF3288 family protein [Thermosynechococcaceae cyanobacterium]
MAPSSKSGQLDQQHPQWSRDRQVANQLMREDPTNLNLTELARLRIRYNGFPGGWDIQTDLETVLKKWELTEAELFEKTRLIHETEQLYAIKTSKKEDWT